MATQGGPAQPIAVSDQLPAGGPALQVAIVTDGRAVQGGAAMPIVVVSDGRPTQGNPPVPVVLAASGVPVRAGRAIPVVVVSGSLNPTPSLACLGSASFADMNTTYTNNLSADGLTWAAQHGAFVVDSFGKFIQYGQRYNANTKRNAYFVSNDSGATWADKEPVAGGEGFLTRGGIVYDAGRDCLHQVCITENPGDGGMIYRRNSITRDGSNNITAITRASGVSVSLDDPSSGVEFPTIVMTDANTLLVAWIARTASGGEIRSCKCDISGNADAGGTASNWVHIGVNSSTTIGSAPAVASYTIPYTQASAVFTYFALKQLTSGDLRWVYHSGAAPGQYRTRRSVRSAANVWNSLSTPAAIIDVQRSGTNTGYSDKPQLISQLTEDAAGNVYVGLATWASNALGDTWGIYKIASDDSSTGVDVYSAGGAHSYAPTGDCAYDATTGQLVVSYETTTAEDAVVRLYTTSLVAAQAAQTAYSAQDIDIPLIYATNQGGKLLMGWRVQGSPPQHGMFGSLTWAGC